ncbi:MAG: hypothetical protein HYU41_10235 [Candidatus Rokubacteria bacterium]|nr:hypothetical protein [Candidatus Rokubacteria bacterium]
MPAVLALMLLLLAGDPPAEPFPPYLGAAETWPPDLRREIRNVWAKQTVTRTVTGKPAEAPLDLYELLIDLPEITSAAGQHLGAGGYRVVRVADHFEVADSEGARGTYRVIVKRPGERVLLARVQRRARLLGEVRGATITRLTFAERREDGKVLVTQRVDTVARIDHRIAAMIAKILLPLFPDYADRKITEIFAIASRVAAWSVEDPAAFCRWLADQPDGAQHRATFAPKLPACGGR